jgi:hypothetical protein
LAGCREILFVVRAIDVTPGHGWNADGAVMKTIKVVVAVAGLCVAGASAQAESPLWVKGGGAAPLASLVPQGGFFLGAGGGYNTVRFGNQDIYAIGTSDVFLGDELTSSGSAAGPATITMGDATTFFPSVQIGYFERVAGTDWVWGARFSYNYYGVTSTVKNALLPQAGSYTPTGGDPVAFTGNAVVQSYQTHLEHQMSLIPFVGQAFERSFVYAGAGPTLSRARTDLKGVIGFADVTGVPSDISGTPIDLASASWVWGGAAVVGGTYFFDRSWFIDVNYTFAMTADKTSDYFSPFTNPNGTNGTTITGTLVGNSTARIITQGITVTINKVF